MSDSHAASPLPAGRRLDKLVATKVMGWEAFTCGYFGTEDETPRMRELHDWMNRVGMDSVGDYFIDTARDFWIAEVEFQPSKEIAAAWLVVENMAARGWKVDVQNRYAPTWACHVNFPAPDYRKVFEREDTAPLAICRAALAAVGASHV